MSSRTSKQLYIFIWLSCIILINGATNSNDTLLQTTTSTKAPQSPNSLETIKNQFLTIHPLLWVIIGLCMLVCCVCALFTAFCVAERYMRRYKREIAEQQRISALIMENKYSRSPPSGAKPRASTDSMSIVSRSKDAPKMKPLSRSTSAQILRDRTFTFQRSATSPKMAPMMRSKSMATGAMDHARSNTLSFKARNHINHIPSSNKVGTDKAYHANQPERMSITEYSVPETDAQSDTQFTQNSATMRSRANTLPLNRTQQRTKFHNTGPQSVYQHHLSPRSSNSGQIVQRKWNNTPQQKQRLQDIPSQAEPPPAFASQYQPAAIGIDDSNLPPIPSQPRVNPSASQPQMHPMRQPHPNTRVPHQMNPSVPRQPQMHANQRAQPPTQHTANQRAQTPTQQSTNQYSFRPQMRAPSPSPPAPVPSHPRNVNQKQPPPQMRRVASPVASQHSSQSHQAMRPQINSTSANQQHVHNANQHMRREANRPGVPRNGQMMMNAEVPPPPPQPQIHANRSASEGKPPPHRAINVNTSSNKHGVVHLSPDPISSMHSPSWTEDDTLDGTMVIKLQDHPSDGIVGMMPNMFGNDKVISGGDSDDSDDSNFHD